MSDLQLPTIICSNPDVELFDFKQIKSTIHEFEKAAGMPKRLLNTAQSSLPELIDNPHTLNTVKRNAQGVISE